LRIAELLFTLLLVVGLHAQEADAVFDDPADIVAPEGPKVDLSPILANPQPSLSGSINMSGVAYVGWTQTPDPANLESNFDKGFGYDLSSSLTFDYKPDPTFHWSASLSTAIPAGSVAWSTPSLSSMYLDYTLADQVFITMGKFGMTWGAGRLFGVNDLVAKIADNLSVKAFTPVGPLGFTAVMMLPPAATAFTQLQWAAQAEGSLGPVTANLAGWYTASAAPKLDLWAKTVLWGADVFAEGKVTLAEGVNPLAEVQVQALAGVYWEGFVPKLRVQGEWLIDSPTLGWGDQSLALAVTWANIPGTGIKPSARVTQAMADSSGQLILGLEADPLPHIHVTLGLPVSWGATDSRWVKSTVATYKEAWALALKVDLAGGF